MADAPGKRVAVLGAGSWGTALAILLGSAETCRVSLWAREPELAAAIHTAGVNRHYMPGARLPATVSVTDDMAAAVADAGTVIIAVPSGAVREVCGLAARWLSPATCVVSAAKGLEEGTGQRMSEVAAEALVPSGDAMVVALSGPNLAVEVVRGIPTATVAASRNPQALEQVAAVFGGLPTFRVYTSSDVVGVELGGAVKNMIAIGCGINDGMGFGDNSRAALMTRGLHETIRLGVALGAHEHTFLGLSGVGDLVATGGSNLSRNYRVGRALGEGATLETALREVGQVAEGVPTTRALTAMAVKHRVDMPVCSALHDVLFDGAPAPDVVRQLMTRPARAEQE